MKKTILTLSLLLATSSAFGATKYAYNVKSNETAIEKNGKCSLTEAFENAYFESGVNTDCIAKVSEISGNKDRYQIFMPKGVDYVFKEPYKNTEFALPPVRNNVVLIGDRINGENSGLVSVERYTTETWWDDNPDIKAAFDAEVDANFGDAPSTTKNVRQGFDFTSVEAGGNLIVKGVNFFWQSFYQFDDYGLFGGVNVNAVYNGVLNIQKHGKLSIRDSWMDTFSDTSIDNAGKTSIKLSTITDWGSTAKSIVINTGIFRAKKSQIASQGFIPFESLITGIENKCGRLVVNSTDVNANDAITGMETAPECKTSIRIWNSRLGFEFTGVIDNEVTSTFDVWRRVQVLDAHDFRFVL